MNGRPRLSLNEDGVGRLAHGMRRFLRVTICGLMRVLFGLRHVNMPKIEGPFILAPNHSSFLDPMLIQSLFPRNIIYMMDADFYHSPLLNGFYRLWSCIPIDQDGVAAGAIKEALRAVKKGLVVGIFPEGRISTDGDLNEGMAGVALLMQRANVPVVPVAILGAYDVLPRHARFLRPGRVLVVYGDPIPPVADMKDKKAAANELKDRVMAAIAELKERYASRK